MKIAIASPTMPDSIKEGLQQLDILSKDAAVQQTKIICFPESYLPGYPTTEFSPYLVPY